MRVPGRFQKRLGKGEGTWAFPDEVRIGRDRIGKVCVQHTGKIQPDKRHLDKDSNVRISTQLRWLQCVKQPDSSCGRVRHSAVSDHGRNVRCERQQMACSRENQYAMCILWGHGTLLHLA